MNYLPDSCVISELVKKIPDQRVAKWIRHQDEESLFLSVITMGEIQKGISKLPDAEKRGIILPAIDSLIAAQGLSHQMTIVTRNTTDMEPSGALLFNP